jgi:exodeoxyribonuclease V alpha subunit
VTPGPGGVTAPAPADPYDARIALGATGVLGAFNRATVLTSADVHVADRLGRLGEEADERVLLAVALAVRAVRLGSVCVDLRRVRGTAAADTEGPVGSLPWPDPDEWYAACEASPLVTVGAGATPGRPVRLVQDLLYLDRYWRQEQLVRAELDARVTRTLPAVDPHRLRAALHQLFPATGTDYQRLAAAAATTAWVTVVAGGPGTGKTTTVARLLALLRAALDPPPRVALAAPTGKAAARLAEAVAAESARLAIGGLAAPVPYTASTLHRLLGFRPSFQPRFQHDHGNRLPYDVVVVDETSMVSLTLMARLLDATRPDARLVLVGDPDQLASVEAGAVLGDLVHRPVRTGPQPRLSLLTGLLPDDVPPGEVEAELRNDVVRLRERYRFGPVIGELADAIRSGDAEAVLGVLRRGDAEVAFVETAPTEELAPAALAGLRADVETAGRSLQKAAGAGDVPGALSAVDGHRLLCAHRHGPFGVARWGDEVQRWLDAAIDGYGGPDEWYVGRPLLVTANDYELMLYNGDTGVVVEGGTRGPTAAFGRGGDPVLLAPSRLSAVQTAYAMTVHRSQGSQFERVSVLLPPADSPLLTRELLYTAVTRARRSVRVIGTEAAVRAAVARPVVRASGLRRRQPE